MSGRPVKPKVLHSGDRISLVAPSGSASSAERVDASIRALAARGFAVKASPHCADRRGYLAGRDETRASELEKAFLDPDTKAVVCLKGGYGTPRILDSIDYSIIARNPKVFLGYSDITALHIAFNKAARLVTFHGPMPSSDMLPGIHPDSLVSLQKALFSEGPLGAIANPGGAPLRRVNGGVAEGELAGGNLSLIAATMGTPWELDARGKILFLEDIDEAPYRIDRMLNQLRLAGKFDECAGIVLGAWTRCEAAEGKSSLSLEEIVGDLLIPSGKPILGGLEAGHCEPTLTLPMGIRYRLDADECVLEALESACEP